MTDSTMTVDDLNKWIGERRLIVRGEIGKGLFEMRLTPKGNPFIIQYAKDVLPDGSLSKWRVVAHYVVTPNSVAKTFELLNDEDDK